MKIERRDFLTLLGGAAAAFPVAARAQQRAMPVIGYLNLGLPETSAAGLAAFRKGLGEAGYVEGQNVAIEYRWALNESNRLPELVADLVRRRVSVIVAIGALAALAAKAATATIPIVLTTGGDPVETGLVASLNRPGGKLTGFSSMNVELVPKRLGLLHQMVPRAARFAVLFNPVWTNSDLIADVQAAAATIGVQVEAFHAGASRDIETAFADMAQKRADALVVGAGSPFIERRVQLATLATYHRLPGIYASRDYAEGGGLMSYGPSLEDQYGNAGIYTARVPKGEKPSDLPVLRPTKFTLVINLQTARVLRIDVPPTLLAIADEVIE